ncbi:hypothetical protein DFH08DRAFT_947283 [Mycena albidolilacea]|uniref:Rpr2-domain-containing protein n=1 Tax=Mycena albidolilacea TaxID=1033008 RepID=A0AAD7F487_9AGAR|nr:hypothetical protein DFH08DRAFT_947283 [Mycena albidolilacea]
MDDATTRFHAALPYALLPISPSLAALHSVRVKSTFNSCQQCGCTLHRGETSVRTVRSKAPNSRAIQTTCLICGWAHKEPLARGNAALFPRTKKRGAPISATVVDVPEKSPAIQRPAIRKVEETPKQSATPINPPSKQQSAPASSLPKSRPKKKGGLHSMLERNKERESREKEKKNEPGGGLAMFLNQL